MDSRDTRYKNTLDFFISMISFFPGIIPTVSMLTPFLFQISYYDSYLSKEGLKASTSKYPASVFSVSNSSNLNLWIGILSSVAREA